MTKTLFLLRGVSGCGKTTLATQLCDIPNTVSIAADDYHYDEEGNYNWYPDNIGLAHSWCRESVSGLMKHGFNVVVHNTNTSEKEVKPYLDMAEKYGYKVVSIIVENRHNNTNVHNVPEDTLQRQENKLRNSLKLR